MTQPNLGERWRRWRLVLGDPDAEAANACQGGASGGEGAGDGLQGRDRAIDRSLQALYDWDRRGGLGSSAPNVARWLGDIRNYFGASVVQVMQRDALERLNLHQMLLEPEMLEAIEPDVSNSHFGTSV